MSQRDSIGRTLVANTAANFLGQGVLLVLGLATTPYIVNQLGATLYGFLALLFAYIEAFALADLGINASVVKYLAEVLPHRRASDIAAYLGTALYLFIISGAVITVTLIASAPWLLSRILHMEAHLSSHALVPFWLASAAFFVRFVGQAYSAVPIAAQRCDITNGIILTTELIRVGGSVLALWYGYKLEGVLVANLFGSPCGCSRAFRRVVSFLAFIFFF